MFTMRRAFGFFGRRALTLLVFPLVRQAAGSAEEEMLTCERAHLQSMSDGALRFLQVASKQSPDQRLANEGAFAALAQANEGAVSGSTSAAVALDISPGINVSNAGIDNANVSFNAGDKSQRRRIEKDIAEIAMVAAKQYMDDGIPSNQRINDNRSLDFARNSSVFTNQTDHEIGVFVGNEFMFTHASKDYRDAAVPTHVYEKPPSRSSLPEMSSMHLQSGNLTFPDASKGHQNHTKIISFMKKPGKKKQKKKHRKLLLAKGQKMKKIDLYKKPVVLGVGAVVLAVLCIICIRSGSSSASDGDNDVIYGKLVVGKLAWKRESKDAKWTKGYVTQLEPEIHVTVSADSADRSVQNRTGVSWDEVRPISNADETEPTIRDEPEPAVHEAQPAVHETQPAIESEKEQEKADTEDTKQAADSSFDGKDPQGGERADSPVNRVDKSSVIGSSNDDGARVAKLMSPTHSSSKTKRKDVKEKKEKKERKSASLKV